MSLYRYAEVTPPAAEATGDAAAGSFTCDAFLPAIDAAKFKLYAAAPVVREKNGVTIQFLTYFGADGRGLSLAHTRPPFLASSQLF